MAWFSPFTRDLVELTPEEIQPEPATRLVGIDPAKTRDSIQRGLASARDRLAALDAEGQRIQDEAANTRVAISALEAAEKIMADGSPVSMECSPLRGTASGTPTIVTKQSGLPS